MTATSPHRHSHQDHRNCNITHPTSPTTPLLPVSGSTQVTPSPPSQLEVQRRLNAILRNLQLHQRENFAEFNYVVGSSQNSQNASAFVDATGNGNYAIAYEQRGSTISIRVLPVSDNTVTTPPDAGMNNEDQDDTTSGLPLEMIPIRPYHIPFPGIIATNYGRKAWDKKEAQRVQAMTQRQDNLRQRGEILSTTNSTPPIPMEACAEVFNLPPPSDDSDTEMPVHQTPTSSTSTHLDTSNTTENATAYTTTNANSSVVPAAAAATAPDGGSFLSIDGSSIGPDDTYAWVFSKAHSGANSYCYSDEDSYCYSDEDNSDVREVLEDLKTDEVVNRVRKRVKVSSRYEPRYEPEDQSELATDHSHARRASRRAGATPTRTRSHRGGSGIRASVKMEVIDLTDAKPEGTKQQITIKREVELIDLTLSDEDD